MLEELIDIIESFCLSQKLYSRSIDAEENEWEIYWDVDTFGSDNSWGVKKLKDENWVTGDKDWLLSFLKFRKINTEYFENELYQTAKSMIIVGRHHEEAMKQLYGPGIIQESLSEHKAFEDAMLDVLKQFLPEETNKVVEEALKEYRKPHLRLVKDDE